MQLRILTEKVHVARKYEKAARFFLSRLLTPKELENLDITIKFCPKDVITIRSYEVYGVTLFACGPQAITEFDVCLREDLKYRTKISLLAHELTHVKQAVRKEHYMSKTGKSSYWMGKKFNLKSVEYMNDYPWEIDANNWEKILYQEWLEEYAKK